MVQTTARPTRVPSPDITVIHSENRHKLERRVTLVITILPFLGALIAIPMVWGSGMRVLDVVILVTMYSISGLGVTTGFHRLLTHRSFDAPSGVRMALAIAGSLSVQGSVIKWVADHRRHHAFTDLPGDPHSPHLEEAEGFKGVIKGLWHSHMGWFFDKEATNIKRFAPDLVKDSGMRWVDRMFPLWIVVSFALPALIGLAVTRSLRGMVTAFIWGSLVRIFLLHHVTWSINSICHFYGRRPFDSPDYSTNNWMLSLVSFGEGWHNNHHAFPSSAVHGLLRGQFDPTAMLIRLLEKLGLARNIRVPTKDQMVKKAVSSSS